MCFLLFFSLCNFALHSLKVPEKRQQSWSEVGCEERPVHSSVPAQSHWDLWPIDAQLFHLRNYTSAETGPADGQSFNHRIDPSAANAAVRTSLTHPAVTLSNLHSSLEHGPQLHEETGRHSRTLWTPTGFEGIFNSVTFEIVLTLKAIFGSSSHGQETTGGGQNHKLKNNAKPTSTVHKIPHR